MGIDILALLTPTGHNEQGMDKVVFENALRELGVSEDTIKDCLTDYAPDAWAWLIDWYFGGKCNAGT